MSTAAQNDLESMVWFWIDTNRKENSRLEFKLRVDLSTPGAKAEFIRDVIALANSEGESPRANGHLVIGFSEGRHRDVAAEHYDGARFGEILDSYVFPLVKSLYQEFANATHGRIGVLTVKPDPTVLHVVNKRLHDDKGQLLLAPGQSWGRKSDRKIELSGEAIHARLGHIVTACVDQATHPLKKRIKTLEHSSGPVLQVKRIRFEIEGTSEWGQH